MPMSDVACPMPPAKAQQKAAATPDRARAKIRALVRVFGRYGIDIAARRCWSSRPTEVDLAKNEVVALIPRVTPILTTSNLIRSDLKNCGAKLHRAGSSVRFSPLLWIRFSFPQGRGRARL
jgi:hypothetical protein